MMFTRAILLLLAMMTGLSAAQAAERARPVHGNPGVSAAHFGAVSTEAVRSVKTQAGVEIAGQKNAFVEVVILADCQDRLLALPSLKCTYRSDRARE
jgi:hypothetical protein